MLHGSRADYARISTFDEDGSAWISDEVLSKFMWTNLTEFAFIYAFHLGQWGKDQHWGEVVRTSPIRLLPGRL
jgi:hypothetical protein